MNSLLVFKWNLHPCCQALTWNQHFNLFRPEIGVLKLMPCVKWTVYLFLSEVDFLAVTYKTLDVFSNILMSPPDDVKDCVVLIDLLITLSTSTAKCKRGFSTMNQLKNWMRTLMNQDTLMALMRVWSSNLNVTNFCATPAIQPWMSGAKTKRHVDL